MAEIQLEAMLTKTSSYSKRKRKSATFPIGEETERAGSIEVWWDRLRRFLTCDEELKTWQSGSKREDWKRALAK